MNLSVFAAMALAATISIFGTADQLVGSAPGEGIAYSVPLEGLCPDPLVIQLDWLPQAEHGGLFQLVGKGGRMEPSRYSGPLGRTGIGIILLAGGSGIGLGDGETSLSSLYLGNSRAGLRPDLALVDLDSAYVFSRRFPATGVMAPLENSPIGLFWDRATYPEGFHSVADLGAFARSGRGKIYLSTIRRTYGRYLLSRGVPRDVFIEGYRGDGENFVLNGGRWLNQGSITSEGYQFANGRNWNRPVDFLLLSEMGFPIYPGMLSVASDRIEQLAPCLDMLIPLIQTAQIDYARAPAAANRIIHDFNAAGLGAPWWKTSDELLAAASKTLLDRGILSNGPDATLGNFDMARSALVLDRLKPVLDVRAKDGLEAGDSVTNRFIEPLRGLR